MSRIPIKVALFVAQPTVALPSLNLLTQKGQLAGVVLPSQNDPVLNQFAHSLIQQQIPYAKLQFGQEHYVVDQLNQWQCDAIVAMGFSGDVPEVLQQATEFGYFNLLLTDPRYYAGMVPLYWQLRQGETKGQATIQHVTCKDEFSIVAQQDYDLAPLDTYSRVENKASNAAAKCLDYFLQQSVSAGKLATNFVSLSTEQKFPAPDEQMLRVNFAKMKGKRVVDMARAGNPVFNGCVIQLGQTPLSLLQATLVDLPTYGVRPGTICYSGGANGLIVAVLDGALRLDVIANSDGIFSAAAFVERFQIHAGMTFT
ncbi:hypothetical protein C2869_12300 [Saccharobesus litoralis]|uniref:Formyl transferase C-terminal domain-containing protein n=1 Tax=Saccharobesus litoralis TaxID=2172099 RepID=A0A2S0VSH6_9ALTE|nr:hypothetical protein [Saccharobesus litoralis]AWB67168.1 hypothetical protein C2869_12300 [Saccharobesus litoralis]